MSDPAEPKSAEPAPDPDHAAPTDTDTDTEGAAVASPPPPFDPHATLAPLSHAELVALRAALTAKLAPEADAKTPPIENIILLIALISTIVSVDAAAFATLVSFSCLASVVGVFVPAFCVFALAPALATPTR